MVFRDMSTIELNCKISNIKFSHKAIKRMRTTKYDQNYKSFEGGQNESTQRPRLRNTQMITATI